MASNDHRQYLGHSLQTYVLLFQKSQNFKHAHSQVTEKGLALIRTPTPPPPTPN